MTAQVIAVLGLYLPPSPGVPPSRAPTTVAVAAVAAAPAPTPTRGPFWALADDAPVLLSEKAPWKTLTPSPTPERPTPERRSLRPRAQSESMLARGLASDHRTASEGDMEASSPRGSASRRRGDQVHQIVRSYPKHTAGTPRVTPASTARVLVTEQRDFNPLKPCGACSEWLKKVADISPDFAVVTFTDQDLHGHFVTAASLLIGQ